MRYNTYLLAIIFLSFLVSCEETVQLDLDQAPNKLIIEAFVTNQPGQQFVRVSRSVEFYQPIRSTPVTNAVVTLEDNMGTVVDFLQGSQVGLYLPPVSFVGQVGNSYHLSVSVDNQVYEAEDQMMPVTSIDSLGYEINEDEMKDPKDENKFYEITLFAKEPQETKDYYLFKFYRNGEQVVGFNNDIYFSDDTALGESINGLPSPVFYSQSDTARVNMLSLTRAGYLFFNDLSLLINNDGGMFGPPPANPRTNFSNGAFGFFQVSAQATAELVIE